MFTERLYVWFRCLRRKNMSLLINGHMFRTRAVLILIIDWLLLYDLWYYWLYYMIDFRYKNYIRVSVLILMSQPLLASRLLFLISVSWRSRSADFGYVGAGVMIRLESSGRLLLFYRTSLTFCTLAFCTLDQTF